jgi:hypothetical protein
MRKCLATVVESQGQEGLPVRTVVTGSYPARPIPLTKLPMQRMVIVTGADIGSVRNHGRVC